MNGMRIILYIY